ncbi:hypothetical protein O181_031111 [Austropuccinia psidii MF-1]|uniref:Chromo domain-containing protein n=1 Tax=Austropuccinia psidii MF-1 TaxID=1389203 RepID=A0A9Q3H4V9_9BASI|nr:hypothetical protein [Austropuccinia psidii MF-1]
MPSQSLSQSRDEVLKEIKDVGEDVAISSLHLFQGNMDLPHLSLHASLEEKWDEEEEPEEIETVLKIVSPAYHQYLVVFSKVKAEKLPPHCACDHHIELEGLLPPESLSQFQILIGAFTLSPIFSYFNPSLPTIVETDASDYALVAVLSQVNDSGKHPIAFDSCKLWQAELNYEIHDKELLGIFWALKCWKAFLLSLSNPFEVLTDHSALQDFMSSKVLTHFQACWAEFLSEFHFTITYCPGWLATLPDSFSYGQTERENQILEQYLWMYVSYHQDDWHTWLALAEFAYSDAQHSSTMQSPFFTIYGKNPSFDSIHISQDSPAGKLSTKLQSVQQVVKEEFESAIRRFKKYSDINRTIPPYFQPGDKLWLASKSIKAKRPTKKLSERWLGSFESIIPNQHQFPPPVIVEEQEEWEVAQVLDSNLKRGKLWYHVEWKGFSEDPERTAWDPASNLTSSIDLVKDFHSLYQDNPGPITSRVLFYGAWWGLYFMKVSASPGMHC